MHCKEVPIIIKQHAHLLDTADKVLELAIDKDTTSTKALSDELAIFKKELKDHIEFEQKEFYDALIQDMWNDGKNTTKIEKFIVDMKRIADVVFSFLDFCNSTEIMNTDIERFSKNFGKIVHILMMRIELEESSKYFTDC